MHTAPSTSVPTPLRSFLGDAYSLQIANVREAARRVWQVPVLRDPVDQGFEHSLRVIDLLDGLADGLMTSGRNPLSEPEIYVLLSAAYLHAIGLQDERAEPDPHARRRRYPEIGAEVIRAQAKPDPPGLRLDLLSDPSLLDAVAVVVSGHRQTDFSAPEFDEFFLENREFRPRLLTALLHLADGLDWSFRRVNLDLLQKGLETNKLTPEQALEGWLHYYVLGVRVTEDYIYLSFQLPSGDLALRELLVERVEKKLRADFETIEDILWRYGVRLRFAPLNARPVSVLQTLPASVRAAAARLRSGSYAAPAPLPRLVELAQKVLSNLGWICAPPSSTKGLLIPFVCRRRDDPAAPGQLVACKLGVVEWNDIHRAKALMSGTCAHGLVLSESRIAPSVLQVLGSPGRLRALTLNDLYRELLDFGPYVNRQVEEFETSELARYYQPLGCVRHSRDSEGRPIQDRYGSLEGYVDAWLRESLSGPARNHISILGDYGSGKTSFCRRYAARQGERWRQDPVHERIPLLILLRDFSRTPEVPRLICEALTSQYGLENVSFEAFMRFNEDGRLLLLLDGFDEMAERSGRTTAVDNFWELARIVSPESKILLTCRTQYFRSEGEAEAVLFDEHSPAHPGLSLKNTAYIDPSDLPNFEIVHLSPLTEEEIQRILQSRLGEWQPYWEQIQRIYNLRDLAQRPVMLDMIVTSLPQIREGDILNPANLYRIYTNLWLERDVFQGRTLISPADRRRFAEELAMEMLTTGRLSISHVEIRSRVITHLKPVGWEEIEYLESDIRTCNFFSRDAEGNFSFAHKSFMEFFAAVYLKRMMADHKTDRKADEFTPIPISDEIRLFIHYLNVLEPNPVEAPLASPPGNFAWVPPGACILVNENNWIQVEWVEGFYASLRPVTNAEYARFVAQQRIAPPRHWRGGAPPPEIADHPVVHVSYLEAQAYASWIGANLPSDVHWQKAARGIDGRRYPWGEEWIAGRCSHLGQTTPVGAFSPEGDSPYGLQDVCGNVWEWTSSGYPLKLSWGGSFAEPPASSSTLSFRPRDPGFRSADQGFRLFLSRGRGLLLSYYQSVVDQLADSRKEPNREVQVLFQGSSVPLSQLISEQEALLCLIPPESPVREFVRAVTLCLAGDPLRHPALNLDSMGQRLAVPEGSHLTFQQAWRPLIPIYISASRLSEQSDAQWGSWKSFWGVHYVLSTLLVRDWGVPQGAITGEFLGAQGVFLVLDCQGVHEKLLPYVEGLQKALEIVEGPRFRVVILAPAVEPLTSRTFKGLPTVWDPQLFRERFPIPPKSETVDLPEPFLARVEDLEICAVSAGRFWLGGDPADRWTFSDALPLAEYVEETGFFLSRHPITNALFQRFVEDGGYDRPELWKEAIESGFWRDGQVQGMEDEAPRKGPVDHGPSFHQPNHPIVGVTWYEALAFTRWLEEETGRITGAPGSWTVLLPSETEWEMACRGGDLIPTSPAIRPLAALTPDDTHKTFQVENRTPGRRFPWGDTVPTPSRASFEETGLQATSPVGSFAEGAGPYGAEDLAGNVWEWTRSVFEEEPDELGGGTRVLRGGSFSSGVRDLLCSTREHHDPDHQDWNIGFRVVLRRQGPGIGLP